MKNILLFVMFMTSTFMLGQNFSQQAVDKVAEGSCECLNESETIPTTEAEAEVMVGKCLLQEIGKDLEYYRNSGVSTADEKEFGEFAETVGEQLAFICPKAIDIFLQFNQTDLEDAEEELPYLIGKITKVEDGTFPIFQIKDVEGRKHNLLWLTIIDNPVLFEEALKGKKNFVLEYYESELYDARIKEYRYMKVLNAVKTQ